MFKIIGPLFKNHNNLLLVNYSPSGEYDPKHSYDFDENVYKKYEDEKRWI